MTRKHRCRLQSPKRANLSPTGLFALKLNDDDDDDDDELAEMLWRLTKEQELEYRPPSSTVSGRHDPLIVDKTSTAEMSAIILQRNHPRPAVRHRFHSADYTRARARFYSRQAAVACMRHIEEISFVTGRIGYMFLVLCNRRNWYHNNHINHCLCYGSRSQKHGKLDNLIGYQCCANCEVLRQSRLYLTKVKGFDGDYFYSSKSQILR